jgi:hypothetical protein
MTPRSTGSPAYNAEWKKIMARAAMAVLPGIFIKVQYPILPKSAAVNLPKTNFSTVRPFLHSRSI